MAVVKGSDAGRAAVRATPSSSGTREGVEGRPDIPDVTVQSKADNYSFHCETGSNLLFAGLREGVPLPYECATGTCGTCKARVLEGDVDRGWPDAPGRAYLKAERGEILMCQARAHSPCTLRVPARLSAIPYPRVPDFFEARVCAAHPLASDVMSFVLELEHPLRFEAGQFVVLEFPDIAGGRAYSMVNYAPVTTRLEFVVKRKPGGELSNRLFTDPIEGRTVRVFGPLGKAVFRPQEDKNLLCIGGGSGIAALMSILSRAVGEGYFGAHAADVFFGVRGARDVFYLDRLSAVAAANADAVRVTVALSDEDVPSALAKRYPQLRFASGFVHAVAAQRMAGRFENLVAYLGGPPPMVDGALRMLILEARLPANCIRYDKFS